MICINITWIDALSFLIYKQILLTLLILWKQGMMFGFIRQSGDNSFGKHDKTNQMRGSLAKITYYFVTEIEDASWVAFGLLALVGDVYLKNKFYFCLFMRSWTLRVSCKVSHVNFARDPKYSWSHEQTKIECITYIHISYCLSNINFQFSCNLAGFLDTLNNTRHIGGFGTAKTPNSCV